MQGNNRQDAEQGKTVSKGLILPLLTGALIIFFTESIIMFTLSAISPSSLYHEALYDSLLLILLSFPLLYFFILKPYVIHSKNAEKRLRENEEKYRSLVESTDDSIYLVDMECRYLYINMNHIKRMGLSGTQYIGRKYGDFHSSKESEWFSESIDIVNKTGASMRNEYKSPKDEKYYLQTLSPVKDTEGKVVAVTIISKDITERKMVEKKLHTQALTDELTGLYNRRGFFTLAEQYLKIIKRQGNVVLLLYADLDNLKDINDERGHNEGDQALVEFANILKENYRESDIIARIGGDEFVVISVGTEGDCVDTITKRLDKKLEAFNEKGEQSYKLSASVGIASFDPENPCSLDELLAKGDKLMYDNKNKKKVFTEK
ncbi:GGDEF domain-containing protein [bacterium]|nr:MAG: GGDEF domain-containing protein [bacterium]